MQLSADKKGLTYYKIILPKFLTLSLGLKVSMEMAVTEGIAHENKISDDT